MPRYIIWEQVIVDVERASNLPPYALGFVGWWDVLGRQSLPSGAGS